jgi:hypothetical protein
MLAKAAVGELVRRDDGPFDLAAMRAWGQERTVRAAVLRHLLVEVEWPVDARGIRLFGVQISGHLDLEDATLRCPLYLESCYLDAREPVCLENATVSRLRLIRCQLGGLKGDLLTARQVDLSGSTLTGPLLVLGADITGQLVCRGARLTGRDSGGYALVADLIEVGGDVLLDGMVAPGGAVRLPGASITGHLNCTGAQLTGLCSGGNALIADGVKVGRSVFLNGVLISGGAVRLPGADIADQLACTGAQLNGQDSEGYSLLAFGMKVGGHVLLDEKVGGHVLSHEKFAAGGAVRLSGTDIKGQLNCRGAQLTGRDGDGNALIADGIKVGGPVLMEGASTSAGAVRLSGADISGSLVCRDAQLTGHDNLGSALIADGMKVGSDVYFDEKFTAAGTMVLRSASVSGSLVLIPAELAGKDHIAVNAAEAQIRERLVWAPASQVSGQVNLEGATVSQLEDHWRSERLNGYWPTGGQLHLNGFTYGRFGGKEQPDENQRLRWIRSQYRASGEGWQGFVTQPYEQLAAVYRHSGQDSQAREIAIARRADLRKYGNLDAYRRVGNWLLDVTIKYGYKTRRAAVGLAVVFVAFLLMSICAQHHHAVVPAENFAGMHPVPTATRCASSYPCFYPPGYAIDVVIPVINVHQADHWGLHGWGWVVGSWIATVLGWAAVTLLVVGYTGLVRQQ